jgi:hypothetical protein
MASVSAAQTTRPDLTHVSFYGPYAFDPNARTWSVAPQEREVAIALQHRSFPIQPQKRTFVVQAAP